MFTTWDQVKEWIEDNNFPHWIFYKSNPEDGEDKANNKIVDSNNFTVSDYADKLDMTEKYLRMYGGKVYGVGFKTPNTTVGGIVCEARISAMDAPAAPASGMGYTPQAIDEDKIAARIETKLRAEYERKEYEKRLAELERREKAFEAEKNSAMGALAHYFAPIGNALLGQRRMVAGVDAQEPVHAQPIHPIEPEQEQELNEEAAEPFTDQEADELYALLAEFKSVEPDYMKMLRRVVEMAKSQDATYTMAKKFLLQ